MILIRFTVILAIIGLMLLLLGKKYNKKITKNIGIGILTVIIIFWIGFFAWALAETSEEYKRQFPDDNTNIELIETNDISNNIIQYTEATSFFQGKISSIKNNTIYFYDNNNQYYYMNNDDNTKYIDGRTGEACAFSDIKEGYYISEGYAIPITWKKTSRSSQTEYRVKATGEELVVNDGNTFIQIQPDSQSLTIE